MSSFILCRNVVAVSLAVLAGFTTLSALWAQDKPKDDPEVPVDKGKQDYRLQWDKTPKHRIISFWNIGPTKRAKDAPYREPYYMFGMKNWAEFIEKHIEPEYKWGCRRWLLHNPFGDAPGPMVFDQFLRAREHRFNHLTDDFVEAWSAFLKKHPDAEVTAYLGKLRGLDTFMPFIENNQPHKWVERALASVEPALQCGMGIGFDASSSAIENGPVHNFMRLLQGMGTRVYVEAWPYKENAHMAEFGVVAAERYYQNRMPKNVLVPADKIKGEIVILVTGNLANNKALDRDPVLLQKLTDDILKRGYSAAIPVRVLMGKQGES